MALPITILSVADMIRSVSGPVVRDAVTSPSSASELGADLRTLADSLVALLPALDGADDSVDMQVQLWLRELKRVVYDAEDALDEVQFDMLTGLAPAAPVPNNMASSSAAPSPSFETRIREITQRLDAIQKERRSFCLGDREGARRAETMPLPRLPGCARVNESRVYGRDGDVETVVEMLLSGDRKGEDVSLVSIVGMGGLGKTTLAQMIYRDDRVAMHFQVRCWVHVSENFDVTRLTRATLESVTKKRKRDAAADLDMLRRLLSRELEDKRFLLVLDDAWCEDSSQWEAFKTPLTTCGAGAGSTILVTTRGETVANAASGTSGTIHRLGVLSRGDCWSLFSHYASGGRSSPPLDPNLTEIGVQIVDRCGGHPFTVKALGGLLQHETDESRWKSVLRSEIWEVEEGKRCILPGLKVSYSVLPGVPKLCLSYCAVIPKIRNFGRGELVRMWVAQGFLQPQGGDDRGERHLEEVGNDCFDNLVQRSFFEPSHKDQCRYDVDDEEEEEMFMMHDVTHDLLKSISTDECSVLEEGDTFGGVSPDARHASVVCSSIGALSKFQSLCPKSLRTFLLTELKDELSKQLLGELFLRFQFLRVLDLSFANIDELPDAVGDLKHLRYLGLKGTNITGLPEPVGRLYNLQTLETQHCELAELPRSFGNLVNLRHLRHQNYDYATTSLSMMPRGIGSLTRLRTLPIFVASKEPGSASVGELKDLNELRGALFIVRLHSAAADGAASAGEANLKGKEHLETLLLEWGKEGGGDRDRLSSICRRDEEMLENLEPHTNLREFTLDYNYGGSRFPKWLGDPSFSRLETVVISGCVNCEYLPPLGQLPSLRFLSICEMRRVQSLGSEFLGAAGIVPRGFPSLAALHFRAMPEWKHDWRTQSDEEEGHFPLLRDITLDDCPKLESISLHNLASLRHLTIKNCSELKSLDCLSSCCVAEGAVLLHATSVLEHLEFRRCPKLAFSSQLRLPSQVRLHIHRCHLLQEWSQAHHDQLAHISELRVTGEELSIQEVALKSRAIEEGLKLEESLQKLELAWHLGEFDYEDEPEEVLAGLEPHSNIRELAVDGYRGSTFAAWLGDPSFSKLVKITLKNCAECVTLPALGKLPSLTELHVSGLPEVQHIGHDFAGGGFPSLEILGFRDMPHWKKWTVAVLEGPFPRLRDLIIDRCPRLEGLGTALAGTKSKFRLRLREFDDVMILKQLQKLPQCVALCISRFPNLRDLPGKSLPPNLKELEIEDCNRLRTLSHQLPAGICGLVLTDCNGRILSSSPRSLTSSFVSLTYLRICRFPTLKSVPFGSLPLLKELCISSCPELVSLTCPSSSSSPGVLSILLPTLRLLSIEDCPMIRFSPGETLPSLLQYMHISGCQFLAEWCQEHPTEVSHVTKLWMDGVLISAHDDQSTGGQLFTSIEEAMSDMRNNFTT